jgi:hypothetical protein
MSTDNRKYALQRVLSQPLYDALRGNPRFEAVLERLRE